MHKRKRVVDNIPDPETKPSPKRLRKVTPFPAVLRDAEADVADPNDPIDIWRRNGFWPTYMSQPEMEHLLARKRSLSALGGGRKRSNSASSTTSSDQRPREEKCAQYRDPRYKTLLATKDSFMDESD